MLSLFFRKRLRQSGTQYRTVMQVLHLDTVLLANIGLLILAGFTILYSSSNDSNSLIIRQSANISVALIVMFTLAQVPPWFYEYWSPWFYGASLLCLMAVPFTGHTAMGAQRWLNLGFIRFQPSDLMRIAIPMMLSWYFSGRDLPPKLQDLAIAALIIFIPAGITAESPDLGSALVLTAGGLAVLLLAGIRWRIIFFLVLCAAILSPIAWHFMHEFQRNRILTFLDPERDPLGAGYHIIQSKIAIGSGGLFGKGWMQGTQAYLNYLPEHSTDFIFAVCAEEFGLIGCIGLILIYLGIALRSIFIAYKAQDTYTRLLAGSLTVLFFLSVFINMGMVSGLMPVVGLPLPLVSYGGTSMTTLMASFGILMSIYSHKKLM